MVGTKPVSEQVLIICYLNHQGRISQMKKMNLKISFVKWQ